MKVTKVVDKEWLDRVYFAYYQVYKKQNPMGSIEHFIDWLYKQYGYVKPK